MNISSDFEKYLTEQDCAKSTVLGYLADMEHFARWFKQTNAEDMAPQNITPTDVKEYKQFLLTIQRRKASTINRHLAALSAYVRWARQSKQIDSDPTEYVKSVPQVANAPKWLDKKEQYALQRSIERDMQISKQRFPKRWKTRRRDASLVMFLLHTGLRLSEATALRLTDVQITERKGTVLVQNGKGSKQRTIPLNTDARKALEAWLEVRPSTDSDFLWVSIDADTEGMSARAIQRILGRYGTAAGLLELTPHICRHTFAKNLVNSGASLEKVASLLGHSNLNTTRVYITPDEHDLELAVEKLTRL